MSTLTKQWNFVIATDSDASKVNQNFDDIIDYLNGEVITKDAATAFTAIPSGPASDPSSANQFSRKAYVDAGDLPQTQFLNFANILSGVAPVVGTAKFKIQAGTHTANVAAGTTANLTIPFPTAFPTSCIAVLAGVGDSSNAPTLPPWTQGVTKAQFVFAMPGSTVGGAARVNWIAIGH